MADWPANSPWRQGHALASDVIERLELAPGVSVSDVVAVVISHDCDIARPTDVEPAIEVMVGRRVAQPDGNHTHAKNARTLHLPVSTAGGDATVELVATSKLAVHKELLAGTLPAADFTLTPEARTTLQHWLAARYRRAAFPDAFNDRLQDTGLKRILTRILEPLRHDIYAIFFDVDNGDEVERGTDEDTYTLDIYLLVNTAEDPDRATAAAQAAVSQIESAFKSRLYKDGEGWRLIELRECSEISDEALTYRQSRVLKRWDIDYLSLRAEPQAETLEGH